MKFRSIRKKSPKLNLGTSPVMTSHPRLIFEIRGNFWFVKSETLTSFPATSRPPNENLFCRTVYIVSDFSIMDST